MQIDDDDDNNVKRRKVPLFIQFMVSGFVFDFKYALLMMQL